MDDARIRSHRSSWTRWVGFTVVLLVLTAGAATVTLLEASVLYGRSELSGGGLAAEPGRWLFFAGAVLVPALIGTCAVVPWLLVSLTREVAEKEAAQRQFSHTRNLLMRAEELAQVGHWHATIEGAEKRIEWSDAIFRIMGYPPGSFTPTENRIYEAYHPDDRELAQQSILDAIRTGRPFQYQARVLRQDGSLRFTVTQGVAEQDRSGRTLALFGVVQDVTEARQRDVELREQAERLRIITEGMSDGVVVLDAQGRVEFWNPAAARLFGVSAERAQGSRFEELVVLQESDPGSTTLDLLPTADRPDTRRVVHVDAAGREKTLELTQDLVTKGRAGRQIVLVRDVTRRAENERELQRRARYDELTGLLNRGSFWKRAGEEVDHARREGRPLTLLVADIDHFKRVNDLRGHSEGDLALARFSRCCSGRFRATDIIGRLGGEEFGVLLVGADVARGLQAAEKLRSEVEALSIIGRDGEFKLTVSIGVAAVDVDLDDPLAVASDRADRALYRAKRGGRNRVERWADGADAPAAGEPPRASAS